MQLPIVLILHRIPNCRLIEQDYFIDDCAFSRSGPLPTPTDLETDAVCIPELNEFKGKGRMVLGRATTVLDTTLDPARTLRSLTVHALASDSAIGLMAATLPRNSGTSRLI